MIRSIVLAAALALLLTSISGSPAFALLHNGDNAVDELGQYTGAVSPYTNYYTFAGTNMAPNDIGLNAPTGGIALDSTNHRLFVSDTSNQRVLVFNLSNTNALTDKVADYVIGQPDFRSSAAANTQSGVNFPRGIAFDAVHNRLFVAQSSNSRVTVYNTSTITNGMNASGVLGQTNYTNSGTATTQSGMASPYGLAYDGTNDRLYVADSNNNRVLVFDTSTITNGMNAVHVLGQADFTHGSANQGGAAGQATMSGPFGLSYDATNTRLFVADQTNNRVTIFNTSSITDGMNASNVLGQTNFTNTGAATSQAGLNNAWGVAYDGTNSRLFVADNSNRILSYNTSSITDGMNASNVLGQTNFTNSGAAGGQSRLNLPRAQAFDSTNNLLYTTDAGNNRVIIFDTSSITNGQNAVDLIGQYASGASTATPVYTTAFVNNETPNEIGFNSPRNVALDRLHHRLFVSDTTNRRILVFNLAADNSITDKVADNVLGQADLRTSTSSGPLANLIDQPTGLAYDEANNRLFAADLSNHRVLVYDTSTITNGMNAAHVLGQPNFTTSTINCTQAGARSVNSIAIDSVHNRLFVTDGGSNNRILVYDLTAIADGMNASNVLGEPDFITCGTAVTAAGLSDPRGIAYDPSRDRLFVADATAHRVLVYDTSTITNGMNAVHVLGQADFTHSSSGTTAATMSTPRGLAVDSVNQRLFVTENGNNRITVFNISNISDGMSASNVLGQANLTSGSANCGTGAPTQACLNGPQSNLYYDPGSGRIFEPDTSNNRIMIWEASGLGSSFLMMPPQ
jgi:DNA-binding beta-propeller fold protein YncE